MVELGIKWLEGREEKPDWPYLASRILEVIEEGPLGERLTNMGIV
jgi:hypothetical protein